MRESFQKNKNGIALMVISSVCACSGQLLWKLSASESILLLLCGFMLYGVGALAMLLAYRYGRVSVLQPILSLNYVISLFLGAQVLHEVITPTKILGVGAIMAGVLLIVKGDSD